MTPSASLRRAHGRALPLGLLWLAAAPLHAQAPTQPAPERAYHVALRLGAALSSALLEDAVAPGAGPVTATPRAAPSVAASAWMTLRERLDLELELGWSGSDVRGDDGLAEWTVDRLEVLHGAVLLRVSATPSLYGRAGAGVIRYAGDRDDGFLADDAQVEPYLTAGIGARADAGRLVLFAEANAQVHRFSYRALREAGGDGGVVWRGLIQAGAAVPLGAGR